MKKTTPQIPKARPEVAKTIKAQQKAPLTREKAIARIIEQNDQVKNLMAGKQNLVTETQQRLLAMDERINLLIGSNRTYLELFAIPEEEVNTLIAKRDKK
jgi:hypothetical protein